MPNLQALGRIHRQIWIRVPVMPGLNDAPDELKAIATLARSVPGVTQVNLLPYHKIGVQKFGRLGQVYDLEELTTPSETQMERARGIFRDCGLDTHVGG